MDALLRTARLRLAACGAAGVAVLLATYAVLVRTGPGRRWDDNPVLGRWPYPENAGGEVAGWIDGAGTASLVLMAIVAVVLAVRVRSWRAAGAVATAVAGAGAATQVLKATLGGGGRPVPADAHAFPSGHTTAAVGLALAVVVLAPPAWRRAAAVPASAGAAVVGLGTLSAGWHRAGDVVAGAAMALAWTAAACLAWRILEADPDGAGGAGPAWPAAALTALLLAALVLLGVVLGDATRVWIGGAEAAGGRVLAQGAVCAAAIGGAVWVVAWAFAGTRLRSAAPRPDWDG